MMTEKYDRSIRKNIGDIYIWENTTGTRGKNTTVTCGNNTTATCGNTMTGTCGKIIIMATRTYEKIDEIGRNRRQEHRKKNRRQEYMGKNTTGTHGK